MSSTPPGNNFENLGRSQLLERRDHFNHRQRVLKNEHEMILDHENNTKHQRAIDVHDLCEILIQHSLTSPEVHKVKTQIRELEKKCKETVEALKRQLALKHNEIKLVEGFLKEIIWRINSSPAA